MTVVAAFLCSDGVVVAADSMLTSSFANIPLAHHTGRKLAILDGNQVFAFAGDHGQGDRVRIMAESNHGQIAGKAHPIDYGLVISSLLIQQFQATGIGNAINVNAVLPSIVDTPPNRAAMSSANFGRWVQADDLAEVILFLASDRSRAINGAAIPVYNRA